MKLWHTDYLGDHYQLASTVKRLRKRLGPDAGCAVQSVHGVGYRLLAEGSAVAQRHAIHVQKRKRVQSLGKANHAIARRGVMTRNPPPPSPDHESGPGE